VRAPVVLFIGRISPEKGPHLLVETFGKVAHEFPEWKLRLVGPVAQQVPKWILKSVELAAGDGYLGDDYLKELLGKAQTAGLKDRVEYVPGLYGDDLYRAYAESSVYVLPSLWEGVPTSILEAMYFGGAVISSRVGVVPYQLDNGRCGVLVDPGDTESLAAALRRLMGNEAERCRLMHGARQRVIGTFSWERNIQTLQAEICRILVCAGQRGKLSEGSPGQVT
jgi:glycosyltransferase involved in cell wall biosynthesis